MEGLEQMQYNECEAKVSDLLANPDVYAADHVLWVDNGGEVHLSAVPEHVTISGWRSLNKDRLLFALRPFKQGEGLVGPEAARDPAWVRTICSIVEEQLEDGPTGVH